MKPRKECETGEQYISRLEGANRSLREQNKWLTEQNTLFVERGRPAASFAGAVLHAAAEACGITRDPRVESARKVLDALAGSPWSKDIPKPDVWPEFAKPDPARNGADCEMLLRSIYEAVQTTAGHPVDWMGLTRGLPPARHDLIYGLFAALLDLARANLTDQGRRISGISARPAFQPPTVDTLSGARELVETLWFEVADTLGDVEMSRSCLRMDLRATMYDHAFERIAASLRTAHGAASDLPRCPPLDDGEDIPF